MRAARGEMVQTITPRKAHQLDTTRCLDTATRIARIRTGLLRHGTFDQKMCYYVTLAVATTSQRLLLTRRLLTL